MSTRFANSNIAGGPSALHDRPLERKIYPSPQVQVNDPAVL